MRRPRWWFERRRDELAEEIASHLAMAVEERMARGESRDKAIAAARREFGNRDLVRATAHDMSGLLWLEQIAQDFRYAARKLRLAPGFVTVAVLSLAIGIAATVTMYAVVDAADIRALPYEDPGRLVMLHETRTSVAPEDGTTQTWDVATSQATFDAWRSSARGFEAMALVGDRGLYWPQSDETEAVRVPAVSRDFFALLGATPLLGRALLPADTAADADRVLVLSYGFWRERFAGSRDVIGRTIRLAESDSVFAPRATYTIVGVMPEYVDYPAAAQAWQAVRAATEPNRSARKFEVLARLGAGQSADSAAAQLAAITRRIATRDTADSNVGNAGVRAETLEQQLRAFSPNEGYTLDSAKGRAVRLAIVGLVLLVAVINVGNLALARLAARDHEIAVRIALGESRARLVQTLLVESGCIALAGGLLGVAVARWGIRVTAATGDFVRHGIVPVLDARVLLFAVALTALTALGVALIPVVSLSRTSGAAGANESPRVSAGPARARMHGALLIGQVGVALTLLTGAGSLSSELVRLSQNGVDYDPNNVVVFPNPQPARRQTAAAARTFRDEALAQLAAVPGVTSVAEYDMFGDSGFFARQENPAATERGTAPSIAISVNAGFLKSMRIPLRRGRDFTDADFAANAPVGIVSAAAAEHFWPGENPIGKQVVVTPGVVHFQGDQKPESLSVTVVGVIGNPRFAAVLGPPPLTLLRPNTAAVGIEYYFVRVATKPEETIAALRRTFMSLRGTPLVRDSYGSAQAVQIDRQLAAERITTRALVAFAAVAIVLAALGVHGLVAYSVAQRTREIGIRMALGAESSSVLLLLTQRGLVLAAAGIMLGLAGSFALTRLLRAMLYDTSPASPVVFTGSAILLAAVVVIASYLPARRATHGDPMIALRAE
jgi:predicted permease